MSVLLMSMAFKTALPTSEKMVLLVMCDFANDDGSSCFPAISRVAEKSSMSARNVKRILKKLREAGWISPQSSMKCGKGITVHYQINVDALSNSDNLSPLQEEENASQRVTDDAQRVTDETLKGDAGVTQPIKTHQITTIVSAREDAPNKPPDKISEKQICPSSTSPPKKRSKAKTKLAADFVPPDAWLHYAQQKGLDEKEAGQEWAKFRDHHRANASAFADWDASWRNWIRRSLEYKRAANAASHRGHGV